MVFGTVDWEERTKVLAEVLLIIIGAVIFAMSLRRAVLQSLIDANFVTTGESSEQLAGALLQSIGFGVVIVWYLTAVREERVVYWGVPYAGDIGFIIAGTVVLIGANYGLDTVFSIFDLNRASNPAIEAGAGDPGYLLTMVAVSILVIAPAEELLFRGVVQSRLRESWGAWPAIILATTFFGLLHLFGIRYIVLAAVLGVLLGYLYERTDNIVVPILVHGINNAVIFASLYLSEIGVL